MWWRLDVTRDSSQAGLVDLGVCDKGRSRAERLHRLRPEKAWRLSVGRGFDSPQLHQVAVARGTPYRPVRREVRGFSAVVMVRSREHFRGLESSEMLTGPLILRNGKRIASRNFGPSG